MPPRPTRTCSPPSTWGSPPCATACSWARCTPGSRTTPSGSADLTDYFAERARGGVGLIVTGGFAPNIEGWTKPRAGTLSTSAAARKHAPITEAVHAEGGHIALQILHTGRYGYHPLVVAPSRIKSPISPFTPTGPERAGDRAPDQGLRELRGPGARGRLRRRRDHGLRGLLHQPVPGHPHQPAHRRLGRLVRQPDAPAGRDRAAHPRGGRRRTSSSSTACRCST